MPGRGQRGGRGRGRGQARGRGGVRGGAGSRGRGRVRSQGRCTGGGRGVASSTVNDWEWEAGPKTDKSSEPAAPLDVEKIEDLKNIFVGTADFEQHYNAQQKNKNRYAAGMAVLEMNGVEVSTNAKVRALAAAWARQDQHLAKTFLSNREQFGLVEVLKALTLLDSSRRIRVEEKKLKRLQIQTGGKVKPQVMGKFKSNVDNLTTLKPRYGSASGAVCKHIKRWVKSFTKDELEFYALHLPSEPWRKLADICHFHPKKDFPNLDWFLPFCFGTPAPEGTMVAQCRDLTADTVNEMLKEFPIPFSHVKPHSDKLNDDSKAKIAATDKLDQVVWWYEDLQCQDVDDIIDGRLKSGEEVKLPYGKLMERLLTFKMIREGIPARPRWGWKREEKKEENLKKAKFISQLVPLAEKRLKDIKLTLEAPVVVIGDRSGSMEVAIRTSTIIASLLTAICSARLVFFDNKNMEAPFIPTNIEQVLEMAVTIQTGGCTAPAASLWPFYDQKEVVKTFIMVTDEAENASCNNFRFAELFKKYREEVYNARLVFVSFLHSQHATGQMVNALEQIGVTENVMQFKFDQSRPDLTKLDKLFGLLSSETDNFEQQVKEMEVDIEAEGVNAVFEGLKVKEANDK